MPPVVCIVGRSKSGKTTVLVQLVTEFKKRGYRVATIKHSPQGFQLDQEEKDSWRHLRAGSDTTVVSSAEGIALLKPQDHDAPLEEILGLIGDGYDIVVVEGFKKASAPKIEVYRKGREGSLLCPPQQLAAVVTDEALQAEVRRFSTQDISLLADFIEDTVMSPS
ncbi:MAG: molybdopterin-guanine dinucleotide biosynthesis protein B [Chloroflexota bacterium]